jgi:hypothetical protein
MSAQTHSCRVDASASGWMRTVLPQVTSIRTLQCVQVTDAPAAIVWPSGRPSVRKRPRNNPMRKWRICIHSRCFTFSWASASVWFHVHLWISKLRFPWSLFPTSEVVWFDLDQFFLFTRWTLWGMLLGRECWGSLPPFQHNIGNFGCSRCYFDWWAFYIDGFIRVHCTATLTLRQSLQLFTLHLVMSWHYARTTINTTWGYGRHFVMGNSARRCHNTG